MAEEQTNAGGDATDSTAADTTAHPAETASPAATAAPDTGYTPSGVPTLEGVREKIETRYGNALGATDLAAETPEALTAADRFEARQKAAEEKLEEIRASMRKQNE